ncbi:MAG TPA: VWA domain-containing protein [Verrucomicrobiae bacterium]|nr:VWA domain-containing protein [Verrucomicrobiae bacterium]
MTFAHPYFLLLLLTLPVLAWLKGRRGQPPAFLYSSVQLVRAVLNVRRSRSGAFVAALRWAALVLFILALAQPRLSKSQTKVNASGVDIVIALDMSGSMASEDFVSGSDRLSRLAMAKRVMEKFIDKRPNDRIGLVVFATQAYIASPPTLDHEFLLRHLDELELGAIDANQTAIGSGLSTALNRLRDLKQSKSKIVILMTDGQNNAGKVAPLTAAEAARALGVKVYTIGVGMQGNAPMPVFFNGNIVRYQWQPVDIDEDTLTKIANMTGAKYYRADNTEKFQAIYAEIDKMEKTEAEVKKFTEFKELFPWFISPGLGLILVELILRHTIMRRLP